MDFNGGLTPDTGFTLGQHSPQTIQVTANCDGTHYIRLDMGSFADTGNPGVPYQLTISSTPDTSLPDSDGNGIPNQCEERDDADGDGIPDICDMGP
ncbi:MAG: hypothetical protein CL928_07665 [Deltaproteobacteria bacterium]|nr:hypothetical protein [Deltaproteobacteria bacterium]